jgi:hypothetical protein
MSSTVFLEEVYTGSRRKNSVNGVLAEGIEYGVLAVVLYLTGDLRS